MDVENRERGDCARMPVCESGIPDCCTCKWKLSWEAVRQETPPPTLWSTQLRQSSEGDVTDTCVIDGTHPAVH